MPVSNIAEARDAIYGLFKAAIAASSYSTITVLYPDTRQDDPATDEAYIYICVDHNLEQQVSIGGTQLRRYRVYGVVMIQVFTPYGNGQVLADAISGVVKGAFRGVSTGGDAITFRHARVKDVGQAGSWLQTNVTVDFDYDELA